MFCFASIPDGISTIDWFDASPPPDVGSFLMLGVVSLVLAVGADFCPFIYSVVNVSFGVIVSSKTIWSTGNLNFEFANILMFSCWLSNFPRNVGALDSQFVWLCSPPLVGVTIQLYPRFDSSMQYSKLIN